ncbi:putative et-dependent rRNA methyltransferase [Clavispora lusitaniae]|uniref:Et-dependent rRNA methyltransferase n=1 Tax=Clavispora lusitaniae TaxID=36911 RepID=A0ACD0WQK8_CLALS|nr:putative et-dependent rRNA methyltransferase [Clavispora lusitaniae]QFZ35335.1 putative et-dependent rRNA methyltransferase [Clavispora lusitaniae]QFZ41029.1 putative et-dependent rRNA methyltransferase [Clavispora lusitaniae]QFZ46710.1 putative et-dependent rRNA methyltransferase [Clavispora lusitaniae]QFZ52375.1 putative et-dependent rRNA methyltransferase [Clavispora lusitaniae]
MGKTQKKNSKGRLDRYYYLAKEKGYRARSSFKIIQINEKYGHFLEKSKVVIDLCAAPGSWCQVASNLCPINSLIIGVDIVPIKPLPNCITFQSDITTEDCRSKLRGHLKTWKADTVLHDGAPNVGLGWVQDAFTQSQLVLKALKLACENLTQGGTFVTKVFRSKDYNNLMWVFQQLFDKVEATKPPASRNVSAEIFVVCKGFKAPKKMDPRLLDPKEVFEELPTENTNNEAKVFNPEKHTRKRQGYEEGDYLLYKEMPLADFVRDEEPINTLGSLNKLTEPPKDDKEWKMLRKLRHCTPEFRECIKDLRVLGKKDFKLILKFRKEARALLGLDDQEEEKPEIEVEPITEEEQITKELEQLTEKQKQKKRREKKRANELKQKEIKRVQMSMLTDMSIGIEAGQSGAESLFNIKSAEKTGQIEDLAKGKKRMVFTEEERAKGTEIDSGEESHDVDSEEELDNLEAQLDGMYQEYKKTRAEKDANYRAKLARGDADDEAWDGIQSGEESDENGMEKDFEMDVDSDEESDDEEEIRAMYEKKHKEDLSKNAKMFFASNSVFGDLKDEDLLAAITPQETPANGKQQQLPVKRSREEVEKEDSGAESESDFEIVEAQPEEEMDSEYDSEEESIGRQLSKAQSHKERVELSTVEAMTLAHQVALGQMNKNDLINEGINKYSFRDRDNLPEWFMEDEKKHSKITKPITKEAAAAIREKQKELNARPIKKVLEAQGRKKMRALRRLEKIKKKSDMINEDGAKSERDKAEEISRLMRKLTKKQKTKPKTTLVVASGSNKGLSGRPRGVKGKYKMVDGVMKNEQRALKRIAKKHKK